MTWREKLMGKPEGRPKGVEVATDITRAELIPVIKTFMLTRDRRPHML
jgi:hypothetical protein